MVVWTRCGRVVSWRHHRIARARRRDGRVRRPRRRVTGAAGDKVDGPRGSGTGLAAYFAGFASAPLARDLAGALLRHESSIAGFSGIREYAGGDWFGGDVESGPVILGVSVGASGFALAAARSMNDRDAFTHVYRTVDLFGVPTSGGDTQRYATGGPIGNALLLAMLSANGYGS